MHADLRIDPIEIEFSGGKIEWLKLSYYSPISTITIFSVV